MPPKGKAKVQKPPAAPAGSGVEAARRLKAKLEKFYREVEGIPWSSKLGVPLSYEERGCEIPDCAERAVTLEQLQELASYVQEVSEADFLKNRGTTVTSDAVNLYVINDAFVMPLTQQFKCSWVELVATGPQLPRWFVSHWWGTPFPQTVSLLAFHTLQRHLELSPYWICTFANNQHDLSGLSGQLRHTPFVQAILRCEGTVVLLDWDVTPFDRVWCVLENFVSTTWAREEKTHFYDIACWLPSNTALHGGKAVPAKPTLKMDRGELGAEESVDDETTGGAFPLRVAVKGVTVDISKAKASREDDKRKILHFIAGTPEEEWSTSPPSECEAFTSMNSRVRRTFAAGALYKAALSDELSDLQKLLKEFPDAKDDGISDGATPVYAAAMKNHVKTLKFLLEANVQIDKTKNDGATAVFIATQFGSADALTELLSSNADPNLARQDDGVTPVYMAVQNGHFKELKMLLEAKAEPQRLTTKGAAPLHLAVQLEKVEAVKLLLQHKADPNLETEQGQRPLSLVKASSKLRQLLMDAGAEAPNADALAPSPTPKASGKKPKAKAKASFAEASSNVSRQIGMMGAYDLLEN